LWAYDTYIKLFEVNIFRVDPSTNFQRVYSKRNAKHPKFFFPKVGSQMMCHNPMRLWHIFQNDRSHEVLTHHLGTGKKFGMPGIPLIQIYWHFWKVYTNRVSWHKTSIEKSNGFRSRKVLNKFHERFRLFSHVFIFF